MSTPLDNGAGPPADAPPAVAGEGAGTLSVRQAAKRLGVSERTVRRRIQTGQLAAIKHETEHGYEWRIPGMDSADPLPGTPPRHGAPLPGSDVQGGGTPELIKALELVSDLTRRNEQLAGQVGFFQAKLQEAEHKIALLQAPKDDEPAAEPEQRPRPWWQRLKGRLR